MCGILGSNHIFGDYTSILQDMRRGNDGVNQVWKNGVQIGFSAHSITSNGKVNQPYCDDKGIFVLNGELFGFRDLARSLSVSEQSSLPDDVAVFHRLIKQRGWNCLNALDFMAAGAYFEFAHNRLFLFRDWIGEMPLHFSFDDASGRWSFASDISSLYKLERNAHISTHEVSPGSIYELSRSGIKVHNYFDITSTGTNDPESLLEAAETTRHLLETSARLRTETGTPYCAMLSGGIDSIITVYLLLKNMPQHEKLTVYTFHCSGHPEDRQSDLWNAKRAVEFFGSRVDHRIVYADDNDILSGLQDVVISLEDIRCRDFNVYTAMYNRFIASRIADDGYRLVYEGEGPDEALGTYPKWGSFQFEECEIGQPQFRKRMVQNMHKGILRRTGKVMMNFGPLECRSYFLNREVLTYLSSLPTELVRNETSKKNILVEAFKNAIPVELLNRPKCKPQDASGVSVVLDRAGAQSFDFKGLLQKHFHSLASRELLDQRVPIRWKGPKDLGQSSR